MAATSSFAKLFSLPSTLDLLDQTILPTGSRVVQYSFYRYDGRRGGPDGGIGREEVPRSRILIVVCCWLLFASVFLFRSRIE